ncbi:sensor histidine kinase [Tunturibacter empetritectus]|uniref:Signal transduction histidine kinase n=2 Tax=Tunturiibacter empetritectus TaxID=3069691 RepID=A0A7W8MQK2_9BACT|nr:HAMP domain-containing sensor histidine kinase [Edaphobacter lichenicola]MBB5316796.1 signal transduction histidine kinase [Edaphobacter lichenicola]
MQSSTASGPEIYSGKFAALRHVTRQMGLGGSAMPTVRKTVDAPAAEMAAIVGVAEGAGLAHDAGNLLGALSLYSDLLALPGVLHEEHKEYANELRMLSDRSWAMIDRLVNHARAGRSTKVQGEFAVLPDVVDRCRGLLSRVAGRTVEISYGVGAFQAVKVPVESVERILTNLVKNAAEATPWVGAISIHVEGVLQQAENEGEEPRRRVVMTVSDRGCGMDKAAVRRLMQTGGISSANGRGLGFRVVRELVAISGGALDIESQPEVGTSISVEWSAMKRLDAVVEQERFEMEGLEMERTRMNDSGVKTVVRGEAGWIAC